MDEKREGENIPKSSRAAQSSIPVTQQGNGGGAATSTSSSSAPASARNGPSEDRKGKNSKRGGKTNGHNKQLVRSEGAASSWTGRGGGRGGGPRSHSQPQHQHNNPTGNQRGNSHKPGNAFPSRHQHEKNSTSPNPAPGYRKPHLSHGEREPIESCIANFLTVQPKLDKESLIHNSKRDSAPSSSTSSGTAKTVTTAPENVPPTAPVPKPRLPRTETVSQPVTPSTAPAPITLLTSGTSGPDNATPMHPTTPTAVTGTAPLRPSSSSSGQIIKPPELRSRPALPPRSIPNCVSNRNHSRTSRVPSAVIEQQRNLPIYSVKEQILETIRNNSVIIITGDPGSGKSTQLPQYLMEDGFTKNGKIGVTEPRRVAAKTLAERVAYEVGEPAVGGTVGYAVRFERKMSRSRTVIKYMTDGVLVQECANPAHLEEYSVVIIDEAHERSVHTDICFGLLKREAERPGSKLKIIISSATLDREKFSEYFGDAVAVFDIPGNINQPKIIHTPESRCYVENYLELLKEAVSVIKGINQKPKFPKGDILVFLSGQEEIEELANLLKDALKEINRAESQLQIVQCYGALTFNEQIKIFDPAPENHRKVILATNIAETSITIEGVAYVIDCGYFKESFYNPVTGINYLVRKRITQFQAKQRYGRACRSEEGICFRVYSKLDYDKMVEEGAPEITRCNLESIILDLAAMGFTGWKPNGQDKMTLENFDLMDLPSEETFFPAYTHLQHIDAIQENETGFEITNLGKLMASFHLDPSLSRVLIEAMELGCTQEVLKIVALLSANYSNIFYGHSVSKDTLKNFFHQDGDLLTFLNMYNGWLENENKIEWCKAHSLQHRVFQEAEDIRRQVQSILNREGKNRNSCPPESLDENIRKSFVAGYYRQCVKKKPSGQAYRHLANVAVAAPEEDVYLHGSSVFRYFGTPPQWIIYHEILVTSKPFMRAVTVIDPEWIRKYAPTEFSENLTTRNVLEPRGPPQYQEEGHENIARRLTMEF